MVIVIRIWTTPQLALGVVLLHLQDLLHQICVAITELLFRLLNSPPVNQCHLLLAISAANAAVIVIICIADHDLQIAVLVNLKILQHLVGDIHLSDAAIAVLHLNATDRLIFGQQTLENRLRAGTAKRIVCMIRTGF